MKGTKYMTVTQVTVEGEAGDNKFCFCIVEPSNRVLFKKA